jgi:hypothetical protein
MVYTKVVDLKKNFLEYLERNQEEVGVGMYDQIVDWFTQNTKKTRVKKEKEEKDPDRVKKSVPPSWLWKAENKEKIKEDYFGGEDVKASMISQKAKYIWDNTLTDEEKKPYIEKYTKQMEKYREANPSKTTKKEKKEFNFDVEEERDVPENWDGPHEGKYLWKYATGRSIGEGRFDTFEKALNAAEKLSECGGITMGKNGYTLRKGNDPMTQNGDDKNGPFMSWTKKDFTHPKKDEMKKKKKEAKKEDNKEEKKEYKKDSDEKYNNEYSKQLVNKRQMIKEIKEKEVPESDEESDTEPTWTAEDAKKAQETAEQLLESDSSDVEEEEKKEESDDESDDESDEEQVQVETWEYKGTTYLVDNDNVVYDSNTEEKIGSRVQSKKIPGTWKLKKTN